MATIASLVLREAKYISDVVGATLADADTAKLPVLICSIDCSSDDGTPEKLVAGSLRTSCGSTGRH